MKNPILVRRITQIVGLLAAAILFVCKYKGIGGPLLIGDTALIFAVVIFQIIFYRCPHCGKYLGRTTGRHCPYCGEKF